MKEVPQRPPERPTTESTEPEKSFTDWFDEWDGNKVMYFFIKASIHLYYFVLIGVGAYIKFQGRKSPDGLFELILIATIGMAVIYKPSSK